MYGIHLTRKVIVSGEMESFQLSFEEETNEEEAHSVQRRCNQETMDTI